MSLYKNQVQVTFPAAGGQILGPNPRRVALIVSPDKTTGVCVNFRSVPAALNDGIEIPPATQSKQFGDPEGPAWLTEPIFGRGDALDVTLSVIEIMRG